MNAQRWKSARVSLFWLALAVVATAALFLRLQLNFDLSVFFPQKTNLAHDILLEQLKNGPGSRLIVIGLNGKGRDQLADLSDQMKHELAASPIFENVFNGDYSIEASLIPEPVKSYYLLLDDIDYSEASLHQVLQLRVKDLAFGGGSELLELIARDPFLHTLKILERLVPVNMTGETWFAGDGSAVLLAETKAAAVDIAAQERAISVVQQAFSKISDSSSLALEMTGVGAFGVELQKTIRAEAKKRTVWAVGVLLLVLLVLYRKPRLLLLAALPISMGFLVGLTVVTLIFGTVHGITLAFGFTLMGIAVDYPLHLFSHSRQRPGGAAMQRIWPTLRIGAASTAIAYLAIALSGSRGLAQLGVFTASGVIVAVLVTRSWLPFFVGTQEDMKSVANDLAERSSLTYYPAILVLVAALSATHFLQTGELFEDSLSSLSPVPEERLLSDGLLRSAVGAPDMRYQLLLHAPTLDLLLRENEAVDLKLREAVDDGLLASWQSVSQVLPSQRLQQTRRDAIPADIVLQTRLSEALEDTPFLEDAFEPFEDNARLTKTLPSLTPAQFKNTPLASWLDSHLIHLSGQWVSLMTLSKPQPEELAKRIKTWNPKLKLLDLQQSSRDLMRSYRNGAIKTLSFASLVIIVLLLFEQKQFRKIFWITLTVVSALSVTIYGVTSLHAGLTIIHLVALLLVIGLGLDYALFFSREESQTERRDTRHALMACAITTTLTFSILAGSSIPVLKFLGLTVATGSAASFILAFAGSYLAKKK